MPNTTDRLIAAPFTIPDGTAHRLNEEDGSTTAVTRNKGGFAIARKCPPCGHILIH
jgi:hypothetical protein